MAVLLLFAFLSGLVTIAAPCVWPLLPVVFSSSWLGGRWRPLGLTLGILLSFGAITLSLSYLVHVIGFDPSLLRTIAVIVLLAIGATLLLPALGARIEALLSRVVGGAGWSKGGDGFWAGFVSGLPLGIVWAPCAGPILATIATLAATRDVGASIVLVTVAYLAGIGLPLLWFSYAAGQMLMTSSRRLSRYTGAVQRVAGVAMVLTAMLVFFDLDTRVETELLARVPSYSTFISNLEGNDRVTAQLDKLRGDTPSPDAQKPSSASVSTTGLFNQDAAAPELKGITRWLNLPAGQESLTLASLRGKVVLVDFWTYTCINCIRTLPHVTAWYDRYKDDGFVVIGVHSPEFAFERETSNVQDAIKRFGIRYPVAQDNDYGTWKAFRNQYWPAEYLIDRDGNVRRVHFGEGKYDQTEQAIRELLKQTGANVSAPMTETPDQTPKELSSPETYLGGDEMQSYFPIGRLAEGDQPGLKLASNISLNSFNFGGDWTVAPEYSQTGANAVLEYNFHARYVYLVMHKPPDNIGTVRVLVDGRAVDATNAGADVKDGAVTVDSDRLYELVHHGESDKPHILRLEFSPGVQVYAFTFG
jgi:cytochrome c biogenesis protein CcdA/thiol-disulfide isomerase/thioredoxin